MRCQMRLLLASARSEAYPRCKRNPSRLSKPNQVLGAGKPASQAFASFLQTNKSLVAMATTWSDVTYLKNYTSVRFLQESIWQPCQQMSWHRVESAFFLWHGEGRRRRGLPSTRACSGWKWNSGAAAPGAAEGRAWVPLTAHVPHMGNPHSNEIDLHLRYWRGT